MLCTLALGASACGGPEPADEATTREATQAVQAYYDAYAAGDGKRICALISDVARESFDEGSVRCAQETAENAEDVPQELRAGLRGPKVVKVERDGANAIATLRIDNPYRSEPRTREVRLLEDGGRWRMSNMPDEDDRDPAITCVYAGLQAFAEGTSDQFWIDEGREDFAEYLRRTCRRAVERKVVTKNGGELDATETEQFQAIAREILREMIAEGRVREP